MRVAIVHYWLLRMRGGEKVVEALCRIFPHADLYTLFYDPAAVSETIRSHRVEASSLNRFRRFYRSLLPLMPMALEEFDLRSYDLVISSESGPAKGVLTSSNSLHVCYCHSPMRYLWELYPDYRRQWTRSALLRAAAAPVSHYLRLWDYASAARVDRFLANSENVRRRIRKVWRREADVLYPPVPVESFFWKPPEDYLLAVSELVPYKRLDDAVRVCASSGRKLKIAGEGPEYRRLRSIASSAVEFCGHVPDQQLRDLYARCRGLVMPGIEDFGITAVEALASGKPVVAPDLGGVPEIVASCPEPAGVLYPGTGEHALRSGLELLDRLEGSFHPETLQSAAAQFGEERFRERLRFLLHLE